jgi:UDP-N-acetylmuramoyl-tripeptide--D-alanyl-D-alanine ligase
MEYFNDTFKAIKEFQLLGYELFIVTNQSGVGRGYFSLENVYVIHRQIQNDLRAHNLTPIKDFAICPHSPDDRCSCRKPSPQMINDLIQKYHLNPELCFMVGDKIIDAQCGKDAGVTGVLVRHKSGQDFPFFKTLLDFALSLKK